jgi:hypothetical protein
LSTELLWEESWLKSPERIVGEWRETFWDIFSKRVLKFCSVACFGGKYTTHRLILFTFVMTNSKPCQLQEAALETTELWSVHAYIAIPCLLISLSAKNTENPGISYLESGRKTLVSHNARIAA